jgi:hypothetical protein
MNESPSPDLAAPAIADEAIADAAIADEQAAYQSVLRPAALRVSTSYQSVFVEGLVPPVLQADAPSPSTVPAARLSAQTKQGLGLLGVALFSGVCGDALLRATPWGLNLFVWMCLTVLAAGWWQRRQRLAGEAEIAWLVAALLLFSAAFAWRSSPVLRGLDILSRATLLLLIGLRTRTGKLLVVNLTDYLRTVLQTTVNASGGMLLLLVEEIRWRELPQEGWPKRAWAVGRGLLLAAPLLLVFGGLLMAADAVFEELIARLFRFDLVQLCLHLLTIGAVTWLVGGYLRSLQPAATPQFTTTARTAAPTLGIVELGIALGLLDLLFLVFVLVQFQYLFFGALAFKPGAGAAYAVYARRGFFELVIVAALVLPLLLSAHWLLKKDEPRAERIFRLLAGGQIALLSVMMASAVYRMRLYQLCCGLTELRVYTMAFMGWLALVFGWFCWTVLRGRRERFAFGATAAGLALVAFLHVLNPDDLIVRANLQRARTGQPFDAHYTASLSADSIPALVEGLPHLPESDRHLVRARLLERRAEFAGSGWRTWNWSRMRAWQATQSIQTTQAAQEAQAAQSIPSTTR